MIHPGHHETPNMRRTRQTYEADRVRDEMRRRERVFAHFMLATAIVIACIVVASVYVAFRAIPPALELLDSAAQSSRR